jgi:hypothetical protein
MGLTAAVVHSYPTTGAGVEVFEDQLGKDGFA